MEVSGPHHTPTAPFEQETGWAPELAWKLLEREKSTTEIWAWAVQPVA